MIPLGRPGRSISVGRDRSECPEVRTPAHSISSTRCLSVGTIPHLARHGHASAHSISIGWCYRSVRLNPELQMTAPALIQFGRDNNPITTNDATATAVTSVPMATQSQALRSISVPLDRSFGPHQYRQFCGHAHIQFHPSSNRKRVAFCHNSDTSREECALPGRKVGSAR